MANRYTKKRHMRNKKYKKMVGGALSQTEIQQLQNQFHFNEDQIQSLQQFNIPFNDIISRVNQAVNQGETGFAERITIELLNENIFGNIPNANDDEHSFNMDNSNLDLSMDHSNGSLHLSDLDVSRDSMSANTTNADESFASETGGKKRRRKTTCKLRTCKKGRKQRGGMCFGNGVGANSYDPNFSIYNTRELQLFPYKHN